jgi:hypothetical protein
MDWFADNLNLVGQALHSIEGLYAVHMYQNKTSKDGNRSATRAQRAQLAIFFTVICAKVALAVPQIE